MNCPCVSKQPGYGFPPACFGIQVQARIGDASRYGPLSLAYNCRMAAKDNMGEQFIDVFHRSRSHIPPHDTSGTEYFYENFYGRPLAELEHFEKINPEGDYIFTGTREAANDIIDSEGRPYLHKYRIPASMVRPERFADDMSKPNSTPVRKWGDTAPLELWETTPAQTHLVTPDSVVKYTNNNEDWGSLSHIIHKQSVRSGKIQYLGMEED